MRTSSPAATRLFCTVLLILLGAGVAQARNPSVQDTPRSYRPQEASLQQSAGDPPSRSQQEEADEVIDHERPDVTNGTLILPRGLVQLEFGGHYTRVTSRERGFGWPIALRLGISDWLEARLSADGLVGREDEGSSPNGFGNIQLGAKIRLWATPNETAALCLLPEFNLPAGSKAKDLGTDELGRPMWASSMT